jgi:hypothetical protein
MYMNDQVVAELVPVMKEQWDEWKRLRGIALAAAGRATLAELRENPVEKERLAEAVRSNLATARAAANDNSLRKVQEGWEHVELDPEASEAEKEAAKLQGTWRKFRSHRQDKQNGPFIYKQKPFEAHEEEQLLNEIIFQTRNR